MTIFGLIGQNIDYSFSRKYFLEKFKNENRNCDYINFDLDKIEDFNTIFETTKKIGGLNVTIPYKESIIPYLDELEADATSIGAVNTIKIKNGKRIGYNTDHFGFRESIKPHLSAEHKTALILGTGGASKAVSFALKKLDISVQLVSRNSKLKKNLNYLSLTPEVIENNLIIVNCTPIGTFPNIDQAPKIPYQGIKKNHLLYDLIYNPNETQFLKLGKQAGAKTLNGLEMLELQAEKSWEVWNS